ncbi:unnamed protein product [Vitrella brassicaformis CCMP3155]|uniref:Helicase ATP-binding domain-containing protein n=3 Tax=Vitrella brassicaformis TaxID=1169539 RepID=A0A0G4GR81_VITBC|nr:unnamed protein product [Vitrella brassicaformis CCMP3155]|eukprot:CEM33037.1 unnamed protein product [Vitrella brassicaformis CCMP3155]
MSDAKELDQLLTPGPYEQLYHRCEIDALIRKWTSHAGRTPGDGQRTPPSPSQHLYLPPTPGPASANANEPVRTTTHRSVLPISAVFLAEELLRQVLQGYEDVPFDEVRKMAEELGGCGGAAEEPVRRTARMVFDDSLDERDLMPPSQHDDDVDQPPGDAVDRHEEGGGDVGDEADELGGRAESLESVEPSYSDHPDHPGVEAAAGGGAPARQSVSPLPLSPSPSPSPCPPSPGAPLAISDEPFVPFTQLDSPVYGSPFGAGEAALQQDEVLDGFDVDDSDQIAYDDDPYSTERFRIVGELEAEARGDEIEEEEEEVHERSQAASGFSGVFNNAGVLDSEPLAFISPTPPNPDRSGGPPSFGAPAVPIPPLTPPESQHQQDDDCDELTEGEDNGDDDGQEAPREPAEDTPKFGGSAATPHSLTDVSDGEAEGGPRERPLLSKSRPVYQPLRMGARKSSAPRRKNLVQGFACLREGKPRRRREGLIDTWRDGEGETEHGDGRKGLRKKLFGYQEVALEWMIQREEAGVTYPSGPIDECRDSAHFYAHNIRGGVLADATGLGKTIVTIALIEQCQQPGPTLVVCPSNLVDQWVSEVRKFAPQLTVRSLKGPKKLRPGVTQLQRYDVIVASYNQIIAKDHDPPTDVPPLSKTPHPEYSADADSDDADRPHKPPPPVTPSRWTKKKTNKGKGGIPIPCSIAASPSPLTHSRKVKTFRRLRPASAVDRPHETKKKAKAVRKKPSSDSSDDIEECGSSDGDSEGASDAGGKGAAGKRRPFAAKPKGGRRGPPGVSVFHLMEWLRVVLDEAHLISNARSQRAKAACSLRSRYRWALTATPFIGCGDGCWSRGKKKRPTLLSARNGSTGSQVFCRVNRSVMAFLGFPQPTKGTPPCNEADMWQIVTLRRSKKEVAELMDDEVALPDMAYSVQLLDFAHPDEAQLYSHIEECALARHTTPQHQHQHSPTKDGTRLKHKKPQPPQPPYVTLNPLESLLRLRQACLHPSLVDQCREEDEKPPRVIRISTLALRRMLEEQRGQRKASGGVVETQGAGERVDVKSEGFVSSKVGALVGELERVWGEGSAVAREKVVVMSHFASFLKLLEKNLNKHFGLGGCGVCVRLDGSVTPIERQLRLHRLKRDSHISVCLLSTTANLQGINLQAAGRLYLCEPSLGADRLQQAIGRLVRIGQTRSVIPVVVFAMRGTVEERMMDEDPFGERQAQTASAADSDDDFR